MTVFKTLVAASLVAFAAAECPNACSGHGTCSRFDMCTCFRNWQANDCSQRTCPFDLAHVDSPKGDLDHSNTAQLTNVITDSTVYPYGTNEVYPKVEDTEGNFLTNSAHAYMECSNKGICDRTTGTCECYDGYDGAACQRASCPNDCSGHGTCDSISRIAFNDNENVYALWDKDASMGCSCDAGYSAPDCSERKCKMGYDPLYLDDALPHAHVQQFDFSHASQLAGTYAIKVYDEFGEDYVTAPLAFNANTNAVIAALGALPNNAGAKYTPVVTITSGTSSSMTLSSGLYTSKAPEIMTFLDGKRESLTGTVKSYATTIGEDTDYFTSKCAGVTVDVMLSLLADVSGWAAGATGDDAAPVPGSIGFISPKTGTINILKACLGDSDNNMANNVEIYNWDHGAVQIGTGSVKFYSIGSHPHAIRLVDPSITGESDVDANYVLTWWDQGRAAGYEMRVVNAKASGHSAQAAGNAAVDGFEVYTTTGVVQTLAKDHIIATDIDNKLSDHRNETKLAGYFAKGAKKIYTNYDGSCEAGGDYYAKLHNCVEKGDKLFVVDGCWGAGVNTQTDFDESDGTIFGGLTVNCAYNAVTQGTGNLYTVNKVYTQDWASNTTAFDAVGGPTMKGQENRFVIEVNHGIKWDGSAIGNPDHSIDTHANANVDNWGAGFTGLVVLFKFTPATDGSEYKFFDECSNRGSCDRESGLCQCFKGYTGDNCATQNALAL